MNSLIDKFISSLAKNMLGVCMCVCTHVWVYVYSYMNANLYNSQVTAPFQTGHVFYVFMTFQQKGQIYVFVADYTVLCGEALRCLQKKIGNSSRAHRWSTFW